MLPTDDPGERPGARPGIGTSPRRTKIQEKRALVEAILMSASVASSTPRPAAGPSMAAITGLLQSLRYHCLPFRNSSRSPPGSSMSTSRSSVRSVPAQNWPGTAVRMTTRTSGSASASAVRSIKALYMAYDSAFRFSGRSMVIVAMPSRTS